MEKGVGFKERYQYTPKNYTKNTPAVVLSVLDPAHV